MPLSLLSFIRLPRITWRPTYLTVWLLGLCVALLFVFQIDTARADQYAKGYQAYVAGRYEQARAQWRLAAQDKDPRAEYALGLLYYNGKTGPVDYEQAAKWFGRAARANHANALYYLGVLYFNGWGLRYDLYRAHDYFKHALAADPNNSNAAFYLGSQALHGKGTLQNYVDAAKYFTVAAKLGMAAAQYMLGALYERGWGVEQKYDEAYYWLKRAAKHPIGLPPGIEEPGIDPDKAVSDLEKKLRPEEIHRVEKRLAALD